MSPFLGTSDPDLAATVMIALQKGGTGKTTLTAGVAYEAARLGARVLLVDLDPNWGLTGEHLGYDPSAWGDRVIGDVISDGGVGTARDVILQAPPSWQLRDDLPWEQGGPLTTGGALGFIPGYPDLLDAVEAAMSKPAAEMRLRNALKDVARLFDLVLIDTGPRADRIAWLGLQAAGTVLGSVVPEDGAAKGLTEQLEFVEGYAQAWGLPTRVAGAVCTKFDNRNRAAHGLGLDRIRTQMSDWTTTPVTERRTIPGREHLVPATTVGAVVWDEHIPQATYVLHGQMERLPVAYGLWPDPAVPAYRQAQNRQRALSAVQPYTRAALRLLHLIGAPCLDRIAAAMPDRTAADLWADTSQTDSTEPKTNPGAQAPVAPHSPSQTPTRAPSADDARDSHTSSDNVRVDALTEARS